MDPRVREGDGGGVGRFGCLGITLKYSLPYRLSCVGRNPCMSGVFSVGIGTVGRMGWTNTLSEGRVG